MEFSAQSSTGKFSAFQEHYGMGILVPTALEETTRAKHSVNRALQPVNGQRKKTRLLRWGGGKGEDKAGPTGTGREAAASADTDTAWPLCTDPTQDTACPSFSISDPNRTGPATSLTSQLFPASCSAPFGMLKTALPLCS